MNKILLGFILSIYCYGDYSVFNVAKGWNSFGVSHGVVNIDAFDPYCVKYYSILSPSGSFNTYETGVQKPSSSVLDKGHGFMAYSEEGGCTIHLATLEPMSSMKTEKFDLKRGWNFRGSNYLLKNIADVNGSCVSNVAVLRGTRFIKYKIEDSDKEKTDDTGALPTTGVPSSSKPKIHIDIPPNSGVLFEAKMSCSIEVDVVTSGFNNVRSNTFTTPFAEPLEVKHPRKDIFNDFNDTRDFFRSNCLACHSLNDSRLKKTSLQLENDLLPYRDGHKQQPPYMFKYMAPLSNSDFRIFTRYIEVLYDYTNKTK